MKPPTLMVVRDDQLRDLNDRHPETGMDFQIVETSKGFVSVLEDGIALPCYPHPAFYDVDDLLGGRPIPSTRDFVTLVVTTVLPDRASALMALRAANISPQYTGNAGACPLVASHVLAANTGFYRYLSSKADPRYVAGQLTAGTYLTTQLDRVYANTGFATVGRYALPIPLPACHVFHYELPAGTTVNLGTVAPAFGQAGGGVEVQVPSAQVATQVAVTSVPEH